MEENKEKIVDLTYLKTFSDGDLDFVKEMVELFIDKIPMETSELQRAISAEEWSAAYKAAHDLKSSANFIGLKHIINSILKIEDCTKNERNFDQLAEPTQVVVEQCAIAVEELKEVKIE